MSPDFSIVNPRADTILDQCPGCKQPVFGSDQRETIVDKPYGDGRVYHLVCAWRHHVRRAEADAEAVVRELRKLGCTVSFEITVPIPQERHT